MSTSIATGGRPARSRYRREGGSDARVIAAPPRQAEIQTLPRTTGPGEPGPLFKRSRRRRWRLASLALAIALPTAVVGGYLYRYASDQYLTEFRFSVRRQAPLRMDPAGASLAAPLISPGSPLTVIMDSQIVIQYLKSRQVIDDVVAAGIDLDAIYARSDADLLARLSPHASAEERQRYWRRMVDPFFDLSTGIVSVDVRAFRPADAQRVATTALALAEKLVNTLSERAHLDAVAFVGKEAAASAAKLKATQASIAAYRNANAVLFPEMTATADNTLEGHIQQDLIDAKTAYSVQIAQGVSKDSQQMRTLQLRVTALQTEMQGVAGHLARSDTGSAYNTSLASVLSGYRVLEIEEQIAARIYERALIALQDAKNEAAQQSIYLAAFVRPALPEDSMYPIRWRIMLETALAGFVAWCLLQLLYHGIRDHID